MTFALNPDLAQDLPPTVTTILQEFVATLATTMTLESVIPLRPYNYYTSAGSVSFYEFASHRTHLVRPLAAVPAALGGLGMTVSPDGRWLVYTRSADWQGDIMMISGH